MRKLLSALAILSLTAFFCVGLIRLDPFRMLCDSMDRFFGAPPKWTQVTNLYRNPKTQEITYGDDPTDSLGKLKEYWRASSGSGRIVFIGNSQMHAINLAPGEPPATSPEKTYFDLVADDMWRTEPGELLYRLSSSGMSYPEVVWELNYMLDDPDLRPTVVLLQMNYQVLLDRRHSRQSGCRCCPAPPFGNGSTPWLQAAARMLPLIETH